MLLLDDNNDDGDKLDRWASRSNSICNFLPTFLLVGGDGESTPSILPPVVPERILLLLPIIGDGIGRFLLTINIDDDASEFINDVLVR